MKVIYDARWLRVDGTFDGVSRYSHELGRALHEAGELDITWLVCDPRQLDLLPKAPFVMANDPSNIRELWLARKLNRLAPDVVYSPFFVMGNWLRRYKLVLTIHDTIYFHHRTPPHWLPPHIRLGWWLFHTARWPMRLVLNRADHIATVSQTAQKELENWRLTKRPITTVSNAVSSKFEPRQAKTERWKSRDILHMGAVTGYKNIELLLDTLPLTPDLVLHFLGKIPPARREFIETRSQTLGVSDRVILHGGASDATYLAMLADCLCLVQPSRMEGFGLQVIEAGKAGAPVIVADTPIFREIGGDSVLFVDPDSPAELAAALTGLQNPSTSKKYSQKGRQNAARYTWTASAAAASKIISQLTKNQTSPN